MAWTPGDISGSQVLTSLDHLYESHVNELRAAVDARLKSADDRPAPSITVALFGSTRPADFVCAGPTGNEVEISSAIAAVSAAGGGIVDLLPTPSSSPYLVSNRITPKSNVLLRGYGAFIKHDGTGPVTDIGSHSIIGDNGVDGFSDFGVEGVTLLGNTTNSSTTCSIHITGSNDPDNPGAPVTSNFYMRNVNIRENASLPVRLFGLTGKLSVMGCEFTHNADAGFGHNEEVIFMGNHSLNSRDNGFSLSRGNQKVVCVGNTSENATFWGIWLGGFANEDGPSYLVCADNVILNSGKSGIGLINALVMHQLPATQSK
jgi:hypothetical protein